MLADDFLRYLAAERNASSGTLKRYSNALKDYEGFLKELETGLSAEDADTDTVRQWVERSMDKGLKPSTVCTMLAAVKSLYRYALKVGAAKNDPAHVVRGPKKGKPLPSFLRESEANRLFDELNWNLGDIGDVRARTLLLLLYSTGMRRAEVVALRDGDIDFHMRCLKVTGKRRKQRIVPLGEEILKELERYMAMRNEKLSQTGDGTGRLFITDKGLPFTGEGIYRVTKKYLSLVTTQEKRSPHVMRHTFATVMLNNDARLGSVQKLLGHASVNTTQVYTHATFEELKRTYSKAHPRVRNTDKPKIN